MDRISDIVQINGAILASDNSTPNLFEIVPPAATEILPAGSNPFIDPRRMEVDAAGRVVIVDVRSKKVLRVDPIAKTAEESRST